MSWSHTPTGFIEVSVTKEMQAEAEKRNQFFYNKLGNAGTHRTDKSRQRITGYLAEMAVISVFPKFEFSKDPQVDFLFKNLTFDVKSQGCNSAPMPGYVGTLYEEQSSRQVDCYIFTRVKNDSSRVWITGFMLKKDFLSTAKLIPAGVKNNNFVYDQARYELQYGNMIKPKKFVGSLLS